MRRTAIAVLLAVLAASCSTPETTTTTAPPETTTPSTAPATTTTLAPLPFTALATSVAGLAGVPDGPTLSAGIGRELGAAFDDLAGGIIFEQLIDGVWSTWYLEAGRQEPIEFSIPGARLGDVDFVAERPPTAALWDDRTLILQTVKGGAPEVFVIADLPLPGDVTGVSLGGDIVGVSTTEDGECHDLTLLSIEGELVAGPLGVCSALPAQVTSTGNHAVLLDAGTSTRVIFVNLETGDEIARWQVDDEVISVTAGQETAILASPDTIERVDAAGNREDLGWIALGTPVGATELRAPVTPSDLATLGGISVPIDCSARGLPDPAPSSGLTPAADRTRTAIVGAALDCAYWRLASFAAPDFEGPDDLALTIIEREADGIPVMADIANTLGQAHGERSDPDGGVEFVWPSILDDEPTDQDWELLRLLYNEERIEEWREGRAPFDGLSIVITETGNWTELGGVPAG